ncbi:amino acid decarboxylase lolD2 [Caerostris extrusa]|uniref:Amino acid decarboxylase lolD2 n=1 Tax=Caerostris extrusa TaxID=172846 RepID=A0AAV4PC71_CAEEX|nr:amino acid decarboxylase lolD2 [Caerostris extrusa]
MHSNNSRIPIRDSPRLENCFYALFRPFVFSSGRVLNVQCTIKQEPLARANIYKYLSEEPFLVFHCAEAEKKVKEWKEAMPRVAMFYAVKVNSDPALLRTLAALNVGFDCGSKNEIDAVINLRVPANRIVYSNCYKGASHLRHAVQLGVDFTVFDNRDELVKIKLLHPCAQLLLRIKIVASSAFVPMACKFDVIWT